MIEKINGNVDPEIFSSPEIQIPDNSDITNMYL